MVSIDLKNILGKYAPTLPLKEEGRLTALFRFSWLPYLNLLATSIRMLLVMYCLTYSER